MGLCIVFLDRPDWPGFFLSGTGRVLLGPKSLPEKQEDGIRAARPRPS